MKMSGIMFQTKISGINCYIHCVNFNTDDFVVYDRRGYKADWLARKITFEQYCEIIDEINKFGNLY